MNKPILSLSAIDSCLTFEMLRDPTTILGEAVVRNFPEIMTYIIATYPMGDFQVAQLSMVKRREAVLRILNTYVTVEHD